MQSFIEKLESMFPHCPIISLGELVYKIVNISKVRVGDEKYRTVTSYDEISLNDIDEYGYITVTPGQKELGPANASSIKSQSLYYGDVVLTHRGNVFKVGVVGKYYERVIVGNNSMIRIQIKDNRYRSFNSVSETNIDLSRYIQSYLQASFVKEYLSSHIVCGTHGERRILSAAILSKLPIPAYNENNNSNFRFASIIETRIDLIAKAQKLLDDAKRVLEVCEKRKEDALMVQCCDTGYEKVREDGEYMRVFEELQKLTDKIRE